MIDHLIGEVCTKYGIPPVAWRFNARMKSSGGRAFFSENRIDFNPKYFGAISESEQRQTVIHEIAHIVAYRLYGDCGHGRGWKHVMRTLGAPARRCHSVQLQNLPMVYCLCGERPIGKVRYGRLLKGTGYSCRTCRSPIRAHKKENPDLIDFFNSLPK